MSAESTPAAMGQAPLDPREPRVLETLTALARDRAHRDLAGRLAELSRFVAEDARDLDADLGDAMPASGGNVVVASAKHLLARGGKRLRPICVILASRVGRGFDARARELAIAVELVHAATLLHDDVVDDSPTRPARCAGRAHALRQRRQHLRGRLAPRGRAAARPAGERRRHARSAARRRSRR